MIFKGGPKLYPETETLHRMGRAAEPCFSGPFRVLVWNMYKAKRKTWSEDFAVLAARSDLILLQEAVLNTSFDSMFTASDRFEWLMAKGHASMKTDIATGVKTGSVVPCASHVFFVSPDREPLLKTPKLLLATTYPVEGSTKPLLVVNIHAINFVGYGKFARQIEQLVATLATHDGPVLLGGDFNTWNLRRYERLKAVTDAFWLQELSLSRRAHRRHMGRHLDHIFYRGLRPRMTEVIQTLRSSDHDPLLAEFEIDL